MPVYKIIFSPTGGTQKVADSFTSAFSQESIPVDLTDGTINISSYHFTSKDVCIAAIPSYGGRAPEIAVSRLKQISGGGAKAIIIAVYGNRAYEDTLLELNNTLTDAGFSCIAAIAAVAEHSIMRQFASGRPDNEDARDLADFAKKIRRKIESGNLSNALILPGNIPYRKYDGVPMKPKAGKACTKCGLCAAKCPVGAIPAANPVTTDNKKCISCMRCITICPNNARNINKIILDVAAHKMKKVCDVRKKNELFL